MLKPGDPQPGLPSNYNYGGVVNYTGTGQLAPGDVNTSGGDVSSAIVGTPQDQTSIQDVNQATPPPKPTIQTSDTAQNDVNGLGDEIKQAQETGYDASKDIALGQQGQDLLTKKREELAARRQSETQRIEEEFRLLGEQQKRDQQGETGATSVKLARLGGYLGESSAAMQYEVGLEMRHREEQQNLLVKKNTALAQSEQAFIDGDYETAKLMLDDAKDTEKMIYERKAQYAEQQMKARDQQMKEEQFNFDMEKSIADITGMFRDEPIFQSVQQDLKNAMDIAGLTGEFMGAETLEAKKMVIDQALDQQAFDLEAWYKENQIELEREGINLDMIKAQASEGTASAKEETNLRKEFNGLPTVKDYNAVTQNITNIEGAYNEAITKGKDRKSKAAADQVLIVAFNKMIDPTSAVREGEFARSTAGQSVINQLAGKAQSALQGGVALADGDRKAILDAAQRLFSGYNELYNSKVEEYRGYAEDMGLDPDKVVKPLINTETGQTTTLDDWLRLNTDKVSQVEDLLNQGYSPDEIWEAVQ